MRTLDHSQAKPGADTPHCRLSECDVETIGRAECHTHPTSACVAHRYPGELVEYMKAHGRKKVLYGSNYPMITPAQALRRLDELELPDEARELFLAGNARRLFPD